MCRYAWVWASSIHGYQRNLCADEKQSKNDESGPIPRGLSFERFIAHVQLTELHRSDNGCAGTYEDSHLVTSPSQADLGTLPNQDATERLACCAHSRMTHMCRYAHMSEALWAHVSLGDAVASQCSARWRRASVDALHSGSWTRNGPLVYPISAAATRSLS